MTLNVVCVTVRVAVAVPLLPADEVRSPVTFVWVPTVLLVTSTLSVQVDAPATVPAVRLIDPLDATAVGVPPQVFATPGVGATVTPAGSASVKSSPVDAVVAFAVLSIVNVSVLVPPLAIGSSANAFVNTGIAATINVSVAVPLLPAVDVRSPVTFV